MAHHFILLWFNPFDRTVDRLIGTDSGLSNLCLSCRFACQQSYLHSEVRGWVSLTMTFIDKFLYIYIYIYILYTYIYNSIWIIVRVVTSSKIYYSEFNGVKKSSGIQFPSFQIPKIKQKTYDRSYKHKKYCINPSCFFRSCYCNDDIYL